MRWEPLRVKQRGVGNGVLDTLCAGAKFLPGSGLKIPLDRPPGLYQGRQEASKAARRQQGSAARGVS